MKKLFSACVLATSLLTFCQLAAAVDAVKLCPSLLKFRDLPITSITKSYYGDRYQVTFKELHEDNDQDPNRTTSTYETYSFTVIGIKAKDSVDAALQVQKALSAAAGTQPNATRIEPAGYNFNCIYTLDFSKSGAEYNNSFPTAIASMQGTETQDLFVSPENLQIK